MTGVRFRVSMNHVPWPITGTCCPMGPNFRSSILSRFVAIAIVPSLSRDAYSEDAPSLYPRTLEGQQREIFHRLIPGAAVDPANVALPVVMFRYAHACPEPRLCP